MRILLFCHSILSDWNHASAHFLRGVAMELMARGHEVRTFEPRAAWSVQNMLAERPDGLMDTLRAYPGLDVVRYDGDAVSPSSELDLDDILDDADLVLVHEWNPPGLAQRIGEHHRRARGRGYTLLFHDTHHRAVTAPETLCLDEIVDFDGVLAFGEALRDVYLRYGWGARAFVWHEAADTRIFRPLPGPDESRGDLVWVGNWGDEERTRELETFLLEPIAELGLRARFHGVRYHEEALQRLAAAGASFGGWVPNYEVPRVFASYRVTAHVPRRPYVQALPGIPTIRPFEALACGIPLVSALWRDEEGLFRPGDFLRARNRHQMTLHFRSLLEDRAMAREMAAAGLETIRDRHTCAHRVDELLHIHALLAAGSRPAHVDPPPSRSADVRS